MLGPLISTTHSTAEAIKPCHRWWQLSPCHHLLPKGTHTAACHLAPALSIKRKSPSSLPHWPRNHVNLVLHTTTTEGTDAESKHPAYYATGPQGGHHAKTPWYLNQTTQAWRMAPPQRCRRSCVVFVCVGMQAVQSRNKRKGCHMEHSAAPGCSHPTHHA